MGILKGPLTVRRYMVEGDVPDGFRTDYTDALNDHAFREPLSQTKREPVIGWVQIHNLLDADFSDLNQWLYNHYALFSLRMDRKTLPAGYFRALLEKRIQEWCEAQSQERCPRSTRDELRDRLEFELLQKTLPRVRTIEVVWNLAEGWVLFHNQTESVNDVFRKLFFQTFGLRLLPQNPLDLLDSDVADAMERTGGSNIQAREVSRG